MTGPQISLPVPAPLPPAPGTGRHHTRAGGTSQPGVQELIPAGGGETATGMSPTPRVINCSACGEERPHDSHGWCRNCADRWRRAGRPAEGPPVRAKPYERPCDTCGNPFRVRPCEVRKAHRRGNEPPRFCSVKCQHEAYRGQGNPKWRGGRIQQVNGYIYAYAPDHPYATRDAYVMEHRLVMENVIGRYLQPEEEVHHRNHIRDDNRPENLELMPDTAAHRERHGYFEDHPCGECGTPVRRSAGHRRRWSNAFCSRRCAARAGSRANAKKAVTRKAS